MYKYDLISGNRNEELFFETSEDVFYPTDTSQLLIEACKSSITSPKKLLDLGCGCGLVGIVLARMGLCAEPVFASDINEKGIDLVKENAGKMSVGCVARCGSLFEPWKGEKFDVIVDDVAGISDDIAKMSPWYPPGVDCNAGRDGTKWVAQVIEQSKQFLTDGGMLIVPVLSLSNEEKLVRLLEKTFSSCEMVIKKDWFLPDDITAQTDVLTSLMNDASIKCHKKYGKWIWTTYVYRAVNSKV